ncbi:uncharacterized protein SPPG_04573 [Spizellomyces punctatus DAOM BR117]|uniref:Uncharacterized protein n=1 Tax=Spizellomyces punctatus (strain DAOM BR117) TaxID=645134 RepID=A0A0L0HFJ0_SPIPD|nr:uncharacterized protein SPPG_04573 [Spizellomyces punctatus DAOM BR117]KND00241.1 hypothetical protein SPPG_04573 [Spizellomyces punctatus DAOM BR117]|eukprot:XP_016608280.1 hypothetical protein SPPG_04573 [Spizellomyces punctatus DAOM BR117]
MLDDAVHGQHGRWSAAESPERLVVDLTRGVDIRAENAERKVTFQLPSAHVPKPLSAARRHIKPPDPVPLGHIQATIYDTGRHQPVPASSTSPVPTRKLLNWGPDDIDVEGSGVGGGRGRLTEKVDGGWKKELKQKSKQKENHSLDEPPSGKADVQVDDSAKSLLRFEQVPDNPAVLIKKSTDAENAGTETKSTKASPAPSRPMSAKRPLSGRSGQSNSHTRRSPNQSLPSATASSDDPMMSGVSLSSLPLATEHKLPVTYLPASLTKMQTVRSNIDQYRIEQIALRRLRFVIENNEAEPDHLSMIDLVEQGNVPQHILRRYFGPAYKNVHEIRVLLLQSIDRTRRLRHRPPTPCNAPPSNEHPHHLLPRTASPSPLPDYVDPDEDVPLGRQAVRIFSPRRSVTTPEDLLQMLDQVEKSRSGSAQKKGARKGSGKKRTSTTRTARKSLSTRVEEGDVPGAKLNDPTAALSGEQILRMIERRRLRHLKL